jgi:uncharacterized protein
MDVLQIDRALKSTILHNLGRQKVSMLVGARRIGKTALLTAIAKQTDLKVLQLNGEDADTIALLEKESIANYKRLLQGYNLLIIDEAPFVPNIGQKAKLMIDAIEPLHIILTGSSAFDLVQQGEPLTGRTITYNMYPLAQMELKAYENLLTTHQMLEERLIFGGYPETITSANLKEKKAYLTELVNTYLLKDLLSFEDIRQPQKITDLLKLMAMQIGGEVSFEELGRKLGISKNTVERYLDLLSKVFIIYRRYGFSRNLRKEVAKSQKWYFYDNGVRNAIINQFQPLSLRQDTGALWENYLMAERMKFHSYNKEAVNSYFWKTYDRQEIDLIEENEGVLSAFQCKWNHTKSKFPVAFANAYPEATFEVINQDSYLDWIGG